MGEFAVAAISNVVALGVARLVLLLVIPFRFTVLPTPFFRAVADVLVRISFGYLAGILSGVYLGTMSRLFAPGEDDDLIGFALIGMPLGAILSAAVYGFIAFVAWLATRFRWQTPDGLLEDDVRWRLNTEWTLVAAMLVGLIVEWMTLSGAANRS